MAGLATKLAGVTVVIVDDHELARRGTKNILRMDRRLRVVGEAGGTLDAIELLKRLRPDVAVLDIRFGGGSALDVVKAGRRVSPDTGMLILSAYDDDRYVRSLVKLGIRGYLVKTVSASDLRRAVHSVVAGDLVFARGVANTVAALLEQNVQAGERFLGVGQLTDKETEVLGHLRGGLTNREIAAPLGISMKTVERHVQSVLLKLGATSRTEAVVTAFPDELPA